MTYAEVASPIMTKTAADRMHANSALGVAARRLQMGCMQKEPTTLQDNYCSCLADLVTDVIVAAMASQPSTFTIYVHGAPPLSCHVACKSSLLYCMETTTDDIDGAVTYHSACRISLLCGLT